MDEEVTIEDKRETKRKEKQAGVCIRAKSCPDQTGRSSCALYCIVNFRAQTKLRSDAASNKVIVTRTSATVGVLCVVVQ